MKKIRSAVKLESLGDWCCLIKNKLILLYSAVMIGTQTCSQVPMNPRYIQYYIHTVYTEISTSLGKSWFLKFENWVRARFRTNFFRGQVNLFWSHETQPATPASNTACARTLRLGARPSTHPIGHPCTLRCTLDPSGIWQHFFFELGRDFDGLGRGTQNENFESHLCFLVGFIAWECLPSVFAIEALHPSIHTPI